MKRRILFVDDDKFVLAGLRRLLNSQRQHWEMEFVDGGREATSVLERESFDAVVSDLRMPDVDGAQLLSTVKRKCPSAVRIVLSGQSQQEAKLVETVSAHHYLFKPCDLETLKIALDRSWRLRDYLGKVAGLVAGEESQERIELFENYRTLVAGTPGDTQAIELQRVFDRRPEIAQRFRRLLTLPPLGIETSSGDFGSLLDQLGTQRIAPLLLFSETCEALNASEATKIDEAFERSSLRVAEGARKIAKSESNHPTLVSHSFLAGLFHDVGGLLVANEQTHPSSAEDESRIFASRGAALLLSWGLPDAISEAVAFQVEPRKCEIKSFSTVTAVHASRYLADADREGLESVDWDRQYLDAIVREDRLVGWQELLKATPA